MSSAHAPTSLHYCALLCWCLATLASSWCCLNKINKNYWIINLANDWDKIYFNNIEGQHYYESPYLLWITIFIMNHHIFTFPILSYLIGGLVLSTNGLFHHLFRHRSYSFSLPKPYSCWTHTQHMDDIIHADTSWTPYCIHTADTRNTHGRFSIITYMQLPLVFNGFTD